MKARIIDRHVLESFSPREVLAYLRSQAWTLEGYWGEDASVWAHEGSEDQVVVPNDESLGDYPHRMAEVLGSLERFEKRSQLEIARDLAVANVDVHDFHEWLWRNCKIVMPLASYPIEHAPHTGKDMREEIEAFYRRDTEAR